jgi:hypothetical protein
VNTVDKRKAYQREYARQKYQALTIEERRLRNSSKSAKKAKAKYRSNPENRAKESEYTRNWYKANKARKHFTSRMWRYGINKDVYETLLSKQNGICAICKQMPEKKRRLSSPDGFAIDHCHATNQVRGLLCEHCNRMLGCARDSIETLQNAIRYLLEYNHANV